jgi:metal-responsive CopG/Arc/MetJ family transcriptional regulator
MAKVKIEKDLLEKAKKYAEETGYSSVEEFVAHAVEKKIAELETDSDSEEEVKKRLKGLGYI